jgi:CheY-like chemotaxis protein
MPMSIQNKILFLWEDDVDFITVFSLVLQEHGYSMQSVKSFDECIESCKNQQPKLLIVRSFVNEPRDGLGFIRKIRLDSSVPYFPIMVGWADFADYNKQREQQETFASGANAYFGRVFDITDVLREIDMLLNNPKATEIIDR